jgi:hypothetical protein
MPLRGAIDFIHGHEFQLSFPQLKNIISGEGKTRKVQESEEQIFMPRLAARCATMAELFRILTFSAWIRC